MRYILSIIIILYILSGCTSESVSNASMKYTINESGTGWKIDELVLIIDTYGEILEFSGLLEINEPFSEFNLNVYQGELETYNSLYNDSYSLVDGVLITIDFRDRVITDYKIDTEKKVKAEITMKRKEGKEEKIHIEVVQE